MTVSGFLMLFLGNVELQQPVILRQHLHLADGDGVEFCQSLRLRHSLVDENRIQVLQVGQAYKLGNISIKEWEKGQLVIRSCFGRPFLPAFLPLPAYGSTERGG